MKMKFPAAAYLFVLFLTIAIAMPMRQEASQNPDQLKPEEDTMVQETGEMIQCFESGKYCENFCCYERYRGDPMCDPGCLSKDEMITVEQVGAVY